MELLLVTATLSFFIWYAFDRYNWYRNVISKNPEIASVDTVVSVSKLGKQKESGDEVIYPTKVIAPRCSFPQYLKYLHLACLPYLWSVPIKYLKQLLLRTKKSELSDCEKRIRLARMVLETTLVLGFDYETNGRYNFCYTNFRMPCRGKTREYYFVKECRANIKLNEEGDTILYKLTVNDEEITKFNQMFSFLNTVWCVYTHTLAHVMAGSVVEMNLNDVKKRSDLSDTFKQSIDDMHATVSGMNESANHYPADIWGIPRTNLQEILGYNSTQKIENHYKITQCMKVSNFVRFTMKARTIYNKHLASTGLSVSILSCNTIFHSVDHYNMGKYFLHDSEEKSFLGIDSRMITSLLGDLNYDLGRWQAMRFNNCNIWKNIYEELYSVDKELADKTHMFISV